MQDDPFLVLGLAPGASVEELRAARRRLAFELHPDRGGDAGMMQRVNIAFDRALAEAGADPEVRARPRASSRRPAPPAAADAPVSPAAAPTTPPPPRRRVSRGEWEAAAFVVELPVPDAFDALLVVTSWIGELVSDEPPDALEVLLAEPAPCWCRLELLPEGRSTSVGLYVASVEDVPAPTLVEVRDTWIAHLNQLTRWEQPG